MSDSKTDPNDLKMVRFLLRGPDARAFLQGQLTMNVERLSATPQLTAICNLKGRIRFGLWAMHSEHGAELWVHHSLADAFEGHIQKFSAFSKTSLERLGASFLRINNAEASLSDQPEPNAKTMLIAHWQSVITSDTTESFQPQELRLHELGGIDYAKGCYLGQEIVARLWFKGAPKQWLHAVRFEKPVDTKHVEAEHIQLVLLDAARQSALVVARPEALTTWLHACSGELLPKLTHMKDTPIRG